ncbi:MAG: YlxR family protein [Actinobacteria bacterium]|nr:YlxR family protein [Actinomycetota bacterium]
MTLTERTCIGCGRKAPQAELLRFTAEDGALVPGRRNPGRGAYTCRRLACFERAAARRAFARVLRRNVLVDPALARLYTGA